MIKKIGHILRGWGKAFGIVSTSNAEDKLSALRLTICKQCHLSESKKIVEIVNGYVKNPNTLFCTKCKCPCLEKTLVVDETCPIDKW